MSRPIPERIASQRTDWLLGYKVWMAIHWSLSAIATISAALAAALTAYAAVFGVVAAGASALIGTGNPNRRALGFSRAYRRLNHACIAYESNEKMTVEELLKVHQEAEQTIEASED